MVARLAPCAETAGGEVLKHLADYLRTCFIISERTCRKKKSPARAQQPDGGSRGEKRFVFTFPKLAALTGNIPLFPQKST